MELSFTFLLSKSCWNQNSWVCVRPSGQISWWNRSFLGLVWSCLKDGPWCWEELQLHPRCWRLAAHCSSAPLPKLYIALVLPCQQGSCLGLGEICHEFRHFCEHKLNKPAVANTFHQKLQISSILWFESMWQSRYWVQELGWHLPSICGITGFPFSLLLAKLGFIVLKILDIEVFNTLSWDPMSNVWYDLTRRHCCLRVSAMESNNYNLSSCSFYCLRVKSTLNTINN